MNIDRLYGTGVALVTPFNENGLIDYVGLKKLLEHTAAQGADYYVVQGTTGESTSTTTAEKKDILNFVKQNNSANLPIVYGIGGNNTHLVIETIKATDLNGVDAILSVSPYYNKPSQDGIQKHFELIADNSPIPIILYNVPGRTASNLTAATTLALSNHENIIGIKEASGNLEQAMHIITHTPSDFLLISGEDLLTVPMYSIGAKSVISVLANGFSHVFLAMKEAAFANNYEAAAHASFRLLNINPLMYSESNPVGIKYVLKLQGVCDDHVRLPLLPPSAQLKNEIKAALENI